MPDSTKRGVMITGGYTCSNRGDWALGEAALQSYRRSGIDWPILLQVFHPEVDYPIEEEHTPIAMWPKTRPNRHKLLSFGLKPLYYRAQKADMRRHLAEAERRLRDMGMTGRPLLWQCGGGIMNDVASHGKFSARLGRVAHDEGWEVVMTGQTVGPFREEQNKRDFEEYARICTYLGVRDPDSYEYLKTIEGVTAPIRRTLDDAFSLEDVNATREEVEGILGTSLDTPYVFITLHYQGGTASSAKVEHLREGIDAIHASGRRVVIGSFAGHPEQHDEVVERVIEGKKDVTQMHWSATVRDHRAVIEHADLTFSTRFHGLVYSLECGTVPVCMYAGKYYKTKAFRLMEEWGLADLAIDVSDGGTAIAPTLTGALERLEHWREVLKNHRPEEVGRPIPMLDWLKHER